MTTAHLGLHAPNAAALGAIAELDDLLPAQLERAARVASFSALKRQFFAYEREETVQDLVHILNLHFPGTAVAAIKTPSRPIRAQLAGMNNHNQRLSRQFIHRRYGKRVHACGL